MKKEDGLPRRSAPRNDKKENFPVAFFLMPKKIRTVISDYYAVARMADDIADSPALSQSEKLEKLEELERGKYLSSQKLYESFSQHNLSPALVTDLFVAFRKDAQNDKYETWAELVNYCKYSAVPVGRFMLAAFNENPAAQLSSNSLCTALQLINHLQDIKNDAMTLQRIYLPQDLMIKHGVSDADLTTEISSSGLKNLINELLGNIRNLLKDAENMPQMISSHSLRMDVFIILSLAKALVKKIETGDVLFRNIKLSRVDWLKSIVSGGLKSTIYKRLT